MVSTTLQLFVVHMALHPALGLGFPQFPRHPSQSVAALSQLRMRPLTLPQFMRLSIINSRTLFGILRSPILTT